MKLGTEVETKKISYVSLFIFYIQVNDSYLFMCGVCVLETILSNKKFCQPNFLTLRSYTNSHCHKTRWHPVRKHEITFPNENN